MCTPSFFKFTITIRYKPSLEFCFVRADEDDKRDGKPLGLLDRYHRTIPLLLASHPNRRFLFPDVAAALVS